MKSPEKKRSGSSKQPRSETVTIRLDPKMKYLAEIAARKQRRTLSSFIERAVERSFEGVTLLDYRLENSPNMREDKTLVGLSHSLWSPDESERLLRLAILCPELLSEAEEEIWNCVIRSGFLKEAYKKKNHSPYLATIKGEWDMEYLETCAFPNLRRFLPSLMETYKNFPPGSSEAKKAGEEWVIDTYNLLTDMNLSDSDL